MINKRIEANVCDTILTKLWNFLTGLTGTKTTIVICDITVVSIFSPYLDDTPENCYEVFSNNSLELCQICIEVIFQKLK